MSVPRGRGRTGREALRRVRPAPARDGRQGHLEPGLLARPGEGRAPVPAARRRPGEDPVRWRAAPHRALQAAAGAARTSCCSDEPTNHLDADTVGVARGAPRQLRRALVMLITHDRYFLDNVVGWMLEIERGKATRVQGQLLRLPGEQGEGGSTRSARRTRKHRTKTIKREKEWLGRSPAARTSPQQGARAALQGARRAAQGVDAAQEVDLRIPPGDRLGDKVIELRDRDEGFRRPRRSSSDLSFDLPAGCDPRRRGRERHGQVDPAQDDPRPGAPRTRATIIDRPHGEPDLPRAVAR